MPRPNGQGQQQAVFAHPLSYIREERGWTYLDLAEVIAGRVGYKSAHRQKAWRWENWGVIPDLDTQRALADELGVPRALVTKLGWPTWLPTGNRIDTGLPWTADGSLLALNQAAGAAVLDRRGFLTLGPGVLATVAASWVSHETPRLTAVIRGGKVDESLVRCFEKRLPGLRQMHNVLGGGSVRGVVDAELQLVKDILAQRSYTQALGARLYGVAAELGLTAGWSSFDAGHHAAAERYFHAALRASHTAGDRAVGANILKCMSLQLVDLRRLDEALALATAARHGAAGAAPRVVAMLSARQARMHAVLGEAAECEHLLVIADNAMSRADDHDAPLWSAYFDQAEYCAQVAACYLLLQRHQATDAWLRQSLELQDPERSVDRATYLMWRAETVLNLGDVDHACTLVGEAVPSIATARSARNRKRLNDLRHRLTEHSQLPAVAALDETIRTLIA